jgi:hypothetical protein
MESGGAETEILASRPDLIIKSKKDKICMLIEVATPLGWNVIQKDAEKIKIYNLFQFSPLSFLFITYTHCTPEKQQAYHKNTTQVAQKEELHWLHF